MSRWTELVFTSKSRAITFCLYLRGDTRPILMRGSVCRSISSPRLAPYDNTISYYVTLLLRTPERRHRSDVVSVDGCPNDDAIAYFFFVITFRYRFALEKSIRYETRKLGIRRYGFKDKILHFACSQLHERAFWLSVKTRWNRIAHYSLTHWTYANMR